MSADIESQVRMLCDGALEDCRDTFALYRDIVSQNTDKVISAFRECQLSEYHFHGSSGYGYNDAGREKLEEIFAHVFRAPAALVRPHFVSGTHTLATVLLALLHPQDELVSVVGAPYDTMQSVIGTRGDAPGNLLSVGVRYREIPAPGGNYDLEAIAEGITAHTTVALIQRSRGYSDRASLLPEDIAKIITVIKRKNPQTICFVDNCYGEFTQTKEPYELGADIVAGSLIKNPGGGLAPTGGYVVGREDLVERTAHQLTAPGLGAEMGSYVSGYRWFFQGLFMAPHVVGQALMGADFAAALFTRMGYEVSPRLGEARSDLVQSVVLRSAERMQRFCEGVQAYSPVDGFARPIPGDLPGYSDTVIMAAGTFSQGSTIEISADGPMRDPYVVYLQGGLVFEHNVLAVMEAARRLLEASSEAKK